MSLPLVWATPELLDLVPRDVAERHEVVPVYVRKRPRRVLYVAMSDPSNSEALQECELCAGFAVRPMVASHEELREAIARFYGDKVDAIEDRTPAKMPVRAVDPRAPVVEAEPASDELIEELLAAEQLDELPAAQESGPEASRTQPITEPPKSPEPSAEPNSHEPDSREPEGEPPRGLEPEAARVEEAVDSEVRVKTRSSAPAEGAVPVALVVGAQGRFIDYCRLAAASIRVRVEACDVGSAAGVAASVGPFALIVSEDVYPFDRRAFNLLAHDARASLLVWSDEADVDDLAALLDTLAGPRPAQPLRASQRPAAAAPT